MENPGQGRYSLPEELHRYVLDQPRDPLPDISSDAGSSHTYERQSSQRYSYSPTPHPPSLTPATFPREDSTEPASSSYPPSEWSSTEEARTSSRRSHEGREATHPLEGRWSAEEGYGLPPPHRSHGFQTSTLAGCFSRPYSEDRRQMQGSSHHVYEDPRTARPPPHYPDSHYGRHYAAPVHGGEGWSKTPSPSGGPEGGSMGDVASTSRVVLPPVSQLLGAVDFKESQSYEIPMLPRLRLPDQPGEFSLPKGKEKARAESMESPEAGPSSDVKTKAQGKRRQTEGTGDTEETGKEKKSKAARKIYVACDFCRGRKLRCDGSKPSCSNCATRSLVCKYQDHPRRRGPGKAPKGSREGSKKRGANKPVASEAAPMQPPEDASSVQAGTHWRGGSARGPQQGVAGFYQFSLEEEGGSETTRRRKPAR